MQTISTPSGETLVVLGLEEYERLVDQADIAAADKVKANIAAGRDELVPAEVVKRILDSENPIKVWRSHRGLSARDLAAATGLSAPYLSEIESGKKEGSVSAVKKIAEALKVDMDDLVGHARREADGGDAGRRAAESDQVKERFIQLAAAALKSERFTLVDIGCSGGIDPTWRSFEPRLQVLGIDASKAECRRLAERESNPDVACLASLVACA